MLLLVNMKSRMLKTELNRWRVLLDAAASSLPRCLNNNKEPPGCFVITTDMLSIKPWFQIFKALAKITERLYVSLTVFSPSCSGCYISPETHKLWNVRNLCILIEHGTVNGCGNSATWRFIPLCAVSQPSPWASIKWQNGPILENNNNKNTSLYGNNIRSHLESTMVDVSRDSGRYVGYLLAAVGWKWWLFSLKQLWPSKKGKYQQ